MTRLPLAALLAATCLAQTTSWPNYNGDYSGQRFSPLTQINDTNVQNLALAWSTKLNGGRISSTPLMVDGKLYLTALDHVWALDVLDILIVAALFYRLLSLVKGTRSAQMIVGLLVIVLVGMVANYFDLLAVRWIVTNLKTVWLIVFVILFQPELRHALAQFGRRVRRAAAAARQHRHVLASFVRERNCRCVDRRAGLILP